MCVGYDEVFGNTLAVSQERQGQPVSQEFANEVSLRFGLVDLGEHEPPGRVPVETLDGLCQIFRFRCGAQDKVNPCPKPVDDSA